MSDTPSGRLSVRKAATPAAQAVAVFVVYVLAGKFGLGLATVNPSASPVWPPTGIAFAAALILGPRIWPAIFAGAFVVNLTTAGSVLTSLGIALGNTLEAVAGAALVTRFANGVRVFERPATVFRFAAIALASTAVSATIGVATLWAAGLARASEVWLIWRTWWFGDVGGDLVVGPLVVLWATSQPLRFRQSRALEFAALVVAVVVVGTMGLGALLPSQGGYPLSFLALPLLTWAALRFDQRAAATIVGVLAALAVGGGLAANESLLLVAAFLAVASVTTLCVAASVLQRRAAEAAAAHSAAIIESSEDAIIGKSLDGLITSWSPGAERLYGYKAEEVVGRPIAMLAPKDRADELPPILEKLRRGERVKHFETVRVRRDGHRIQVGLSISPIRAATGDLVGASAIARDITKAKRQEQRLRMLYSVTRVLSEALTLSEAAPRLLQVICEGLGWEHGELWGTDYVPPTRLAVYPSREGGDPGLSLRDAALVSGLPVTCADLAQDARWREDRAARAGFHGAQAWPLRLAGEVVAVLVLASRVPRNQHRDLIDLMGDILSRAQQFMERGRALVNLQRLQKAVETIEMGVTITDTRGNILYTNPAEAAMHGYRPEELIGKHVSFFTPPGWTPASGRPSQIRSWRRETVNVRRDGSVFPVQLLSDAVAGPDGRPSVFVTCTEEITDRKRAEEQLRSSEERYRMLFERNVAGVYRATQDGRLIECNEAFARILGYESRADVLALKATELFYDRHERVATLRALRDGSRAQSREVRLRRKDGGVVWVLENQTIVDADKGEGLVEGTLIDITDRKEFEQRIEFHAFHDPLTGLPNRAYLTEQLQNRLSEARTRGRGLSVLFLDLDHFKVVNDTKGHTFGDRLLQQVAARLRECVREDDLVVRMGGDEFVILLPRTRHGDALPIAQKILARVEEPVRIDEHELCVTASIGIARFPDDGEDVETLLKNADSAMYRAKELGRNGAQAWDKDAMPNSLGRLETQARLRRALERGEMEVWYQPQVGVGNQGIVGVEALLRWRHPERGIVLPGEFIPIAEESGLIVQLGEWVLRQACTAARHWDTQRLPALRVSVNLSVRQFQQPGLVDSVSRILRETGLPPERLDLEITETLAMQNMDVSIPVLRELSALGVSVSIDDFGVGYSSLSYLKLLPIRRLKIDRSFIAGLGHEPRDAAIVKAVVRMASTLDLGVVAEGVETEEQLELLNELGCNEMQGWVFRGAIPADTVEELLASAEYLTRTRRAC